MIEIIETSCEKNIKNSLFPASFPIIGDTTYNKPIKLDLKDPHMVKLIDHLKDLILDDETYLDTFKIPVYLTNKVRVSKQEAHFIEYFFCVLTTH